MSRPGTRSQSETLGVVLLLGMTLMSVGALAVFGNAAIDDVRHSVDVQSSEHALSQLDSRVSLVALSEANRQSIDMGRARQGTYSVRPDEGRIVITHVNYTANESQELYNNTMGEVRYETDGSVLAYQGGGVWRSEAGAGSTMVSTPEFHYRGLTLTFPVIRVTGDGSVSGSARVNVHTDDRPVKIYPNATDTYPGGDRPFKNPVQNGTVRITIQSEYYDAWGSYFEDRTDGEVTTYASNETVVLDLVSLGAHGEFGMPMDGQALELRAIEDGHPLSNFTVTIAPDQPDSESFSGLSWSLWAQSGNKEFEVHLGIDGKGDEGDDVSATVYYYNGTSEQGWHDEDAYEVRVDDFDGDGDNESRIVANLTSDAQMTYQNVGQDKLSKFQGNNDFADSVTFDEHEVDTGETFTSGNRTSIGYAVNHYVGLMGPNVDLVTKDTEGGGGGTNQNSAGNVNEDASVGYLEIESTGQYVTYLHLSENNVTVIVE